MIALSKQVDYALICLAHMVENPDRVVSAREIAQQHALPLSLLMKILKILHRRGVLRSVRGVKGGYQIAIDLDDLSLAALIESLDENPSEVEPRHPRFSIVPPVQGLQHRLMRFLRELKVTDLVKPGRRIDVPVEMIGFASIRKSQPTSLV